MRRFLGVLVALAALAAAATPALAAGRPSGDCPNAASGFFIVDQQQWWDITVAGFEAAGIHVYVDGDPSAGFTAEFDAFAATAGFGDGQGLYDFVWITQWQGIDKNDDLLVCMKYWPVTPGTPSYFFGGVDNTAS